MKNRDEDITRIAKTLRARIDEMDKRTFPQFLNAFPRGCCEVTSFILADILAKEGHNGFELKSYPYHNGSKFPSHAWLQSGDLIVDITADQTPICLEPVIVSRNSDWHISREGVETKSWRDEWQACDVIYQQIIAQFYDLIRN